MENGKSEEYPAYFNEEFLRRALRKGFKRDDLELVDFDIRLATIGGENYCSVIYRTKVIYQFTKDNDGRKHEINLILKDMRKEVDESMQVKTKEPTMYAEVIPTMEHILGEKLAPRFFLIEKFDSEVFVLEDLSARGFAVKDRLKGFDEKDCVLVLKKIAKFHAASMLFADKFPEIVERIKQPVFGYGTEDPHMKRHMNGMLQSICDMYAEREDYESILNKLKHIMSTLHERVVRMFDTSECRYKVINHGDFWMNNILVSEDDVEFIDLQLSNYGSPALDINYLLYTSVPIELLARKRYDFLRMYYKEFHDTLKKINYQSIPTWEDFAYEMRRMEFSGAWTLFFVTPLLSMETKDSKGADITTLKDDDVFAEKRRAMFSSKMLQEKFKYAMDRFDEMGVLD